MGSYALVATAAYARDVTRRAQQSYKCYTRHKLRMQGEREQGREIRERRGGEEKEEGKRG